MSRDTSIHGVVAAVSVIIGVCKAGFFWTIVTILGAFALNLVGFFTKPRKRPVIKECYWGRGSKREDDPAIKEFSVKVPDDTLNDLKTRLNNARLGEDLEDTQFQYGFQTTYLQEVLEYWKNTYDWKKQEEILNSNPQFKTQIDGLDVHFIHAKPKDNKTSKVLLLVHGWPGSVHEFYKILPILTDPAKHGGLPEDAFEVICPSIPGYGFSEAPHKKGFCPVAAAQICVKLMKRLGHEKFYVQGGDWGSLIATNVATMFPLHVEGVHINMMPLPIHSSSSLMKLLLGTLLPSLVVSKSDQWKLYPLSKLFKTMMQESGYFHIQTTKPDTIGTALNDSPIGLAAYIMEKFSTWTNTEYRDLPDGGLTKNFSLDELLTSVMIYWVTGSITSSMRFYKENTQSEEQPKWQKIPVQVPAGAACFPNELLLSPKNFLQEKYHYLVHYNDMERGGHFAAFQEPQLLAEDIWAFLRKSETFHQSTELH